MRWEDGEYTEVDAGFIRPLTTPAGATSADLTGNGYQDLVVVQYGTLVTERVFEGRHEKIREMHPEIRPDPQDAYPNQFYEGSEDGFTRKTEEFGLQGSNWSLTASATDLTGDGRTDLHVANDFSADIVYENTGDGFQRRVLPPWSDRHAMASSVAHIYNRPIPEIFVTNIYLSGGRDRGMETQVDPLVPLPLGNNLIQYLPGKDKFVDRAGELGIRKGGWGWASVIADLNNSGRLDLIHATTSYKGAPMRSDDVGPWSNYQLWSHEGTLSKPRFVKREAKKYGFPKDESRGLVRIDLTGNGRLDLIASRQEYWSPTNRNPFIMFKNKGPVYSNFLQISLVDDEYIAKNARVRLVTEGGKVMRRTNNAGTDLLSQDSPIMHFGLGRSSTPARLEIDWHHRPGETVVKDIQKNRRFIVGPDGIRKSVRIEAKRKEDNREPEEE